MSWEGPTGSWLGSIFSREESLLTSPPDYFFLFCSAASSSLSLTPLRTSLNSQRPKSGRPVFAPLARVASRHPDSLDITASRGFTQSALSPLPPAVTLLQAFLRLTWTIRRAFN